MGQEWSCRPRGVRPAVRGSRVETLYNFVGFRKGTGMQLTEHEWIMLSHLLEQALALPEAECEAWLEGLVEPFARLKPTLRALLAQERTPATHDVLGTLPKFTAAPGLAPEASEPWGLGADIGPYTLRQLLG